MAQPARLQSRHAASPSQLITVAMSTLPLSLVLLLSVITTTTTGAPDSTKIDQYKYVTASDDSSLQENELSYWRSQAQAALHTRKKHTFNENRAKNLILVIGDGMSLTTVTAARIYKGQKNNQSGENSYLSWEKFPWTGLSKTYCVDKQVADSACSSTAYLAGVKANYGTLGVTATVQRGDCAKSNNPDNHVDTILTWAQQAGKATGLVTTTRITHASPGGNYAHSAERDWEADADMTTAKNKADPAQCADIAYQLIHRVPGKHVKVLFGGGRSRFLPNTTFGEGQRLDGRNLVNDWKEDKKSQGKAVYVENRDQFNDIDPKTTEFALGLFNADHMKYHLEEGSELQPTLEEMTEKAIRILSGSSKGYYLFVECGKIDLAHHDNMGKRALDETYECDKAVQKAMDLTDEEDTLIVVTADHAHTVTMSGYPKRGSDILGIAEKSDVDGLSYTTLGYANGPSAMNRTVLRRDVFNDDFNNPLYQYESLVPLKSETHGGDDVAVWARGPHSHLLVGNLEQNLIPMVMAHAAGIGPWSSSSASCMTSLGIFALVAVCLIRLLQ